MTADKVPASVELVSPYNEYPVGLKGCQDGIERCKYGPSLDTVAPGSNLEVEVGGGNGEICEEHVGHICVVVLPGVHDDVIYPDLGEGVRDQAPTSRTEVAPRRC